MKFLSKVIKSYVFLLVLLFLLSSVTVARSQSNYSLSYKMNVGDSQTYKITKYHNANSIYQGQVPFILENGSRIYYNLTKGLTEKVIITSKIINSNTFGGAVINYQFKMNIPGYGEVVSQILTANSYNQMNSAGPVNPAFDNKTMVENYLQYLSNQYSNSSYTTYTFDISGDTYSTKSNISSPIISTVTKFVFNWKTGWLVSQENSQKLSNGTFLYDYKLESTSSNSGIFSVETISTGLVILAIPALFIGGAYLGIKVKK